MLLLSVSHCVHLHMLANTCTQSDHVWKSTCTHAQAKSSTHEITELYTLTHTHSHPTSHNTHTHAHTRPSTHKHPPVHQLNGIPKH